MAVVVNRGRRSAVPPLPSSRPHDHRGVRIRAVIARGARRAREAHEERPSVSCSSRLTITFDTTGHCQPFRLAGTSKGGIVTLSETAGSVLVDADLRALRVWAPEPPPGWEAVAAVCQQLHDRLDELTMQMVTAIEAEVPEYEALHAVPRADLATSVKSNIEMLLLGIAEHRGPSREELEVRRQLGRRRAQQGLPVDTLIAAFHIGYREFWSEVVKLVSSGDGAAQAALLEGSATIWGWIHQVTGAVADQYRLELGDREAGSLRRRSRFLAALLSDPRSHDCVMEAQHFGFDVVGRFRCFASAEPLSLRAEQALDDALGRVGATWLRGSRDGMVLTLVQGDVPPATLSVPWQSDLMGVGIEREGLDGARESILDARLALGSARAADGRRVCSFEASWLEALVQANADRLKPLLDRCEPVVQGKAHLAEAVRAFSEANMSLAETARRMHLAANSVRHRLQQWHRITGLDPWTTQGLVCSRLLIDLIESMPAGGSGRALAVPSDA